MSQTAARYRYHVMFEALPPGSILSAMGQFKGGDLPDIRDLYQVLPKSTGQGQTDPQLSVSPQAIHQSLSKTKFQRQRQQIQNSGNSGLLSVCKQGDSHPQQDITPDHGSLQDVHSSTGLDIVLNSKKLKPVVRSNTTKPARRRCMGHWGRRQESKVDRTLREADPMKEDLDEGRKDQAEDIVCQLKNGAQGGGDLSARIVDSDGSDQHMSWDVFPRGQPAGLKKRRTPTSDDSSHAFLKLRSPRVQQPAGAKDDRVDGKDYRLQKIPPLHLKTAQQTVECSTSQPHSQRSQPPPPLAATQDWLTEAGTRTMASHGHQKQQRTSLSITHHTLSVAQEKARTPRSLKHLEPLHKTQLENKNAMNEKLGETLQAKPEPSTVVGAENEKRMKAVAASVVTLCMNPSDTGRTIISLPHSGFRNGQSNTHYHADKVRSQSPNETGLPKTIPETDLPETGCQQSREDTASSSLSHYLPYTNYQDETSPPISPCAGHCADITKPESVERKNGAGKMILKRFNELQVFGEREPSKGLSSAPFSPRTWTMEKDGDRRKKARLYQNRPPTYRLDARKYSPRPQAPIDLGPAGQLHAEADSDPALVGNLADTAVNHRPAYLVDATALSFRFRDGEVIVSRQGRKPILMG